ncbi:MAG: histone deacetylase [Candidatus Aminicenantes bacterium]|nr:histone deacetylase [Candidatus Aminicenantes bacterium]
MKTGIIFDLRFAHHEMGTGHIESPARIRALEKIVWDSLDEKAILVSPRPATEQEISLVHLPSYIDYLKQTPAHGYTAFDPDTIAGPQTFATACLAAGAGLTAAEKILAGEIENAFALVRPPGHHAESARPMGFCFFNNLAITAEFLRQKIGLRKIMIVDWDLHHGNGTQKAFYYTPEVFFISLHQTPLFPGTGAIGEVGEKNGAGFNLNLPLKPGKKDEDYLYIFQKIIQPLADLYQPEFILVSAGFDVLSGDPLGKMELTVEGCGDLTQIILELAKKWAENRLILFLEGGYDLNLLQEGVAEVLKRLKGQLKPKIPQASCSEELCRELAPLIPLLQKYWGFILER